MKNVKSVTYGAMTVALFSMLMLLDRLFVGNLGFMMSIIIPIPLIIYGLKFSLKESGIVYLTMIFSSILFNGMPPAIISVLGFGFVGLVMIYTYEQEYSAFKKNVLLFFSMGIVYLIMIAFFSSYFGLSIQETVDTIVRYFPNVSVLILYTVTWTSVVLTILMEIYILNTATKLLSQRLEKHLRK